jgi:hypothetical protein
MENLNSIIEKLIPIVAGLGQLIVAITVTWATLSIFFKKLRVFAIKIFNSFSKFIIPSLVLIVPVGGIMWLAIYWIVQEAASIIREPKLFVFFIFLSTTFVSLYSFFWGVWLYPCLISIQKRVINQLFAGSTDTKNSNHTQISQNQEGDKS